ncbi:MAG: DUF364 domain-containing protein [Burkholderiales bacterium]|jgi:uncharacterized protein (DUF4213/DUF364 family)|nr:DUF364 domain-containing protein [Burkholderiales bacterium]
MEDFYSEQLARTHQMIAENLGDEMNGIVIERAVLGVFFCSVWLSNGASGLCATPMTAIPEAICCPSSAKAFPTPGKQRGRKIKDLLDDLYSPHPLRRALALAGLNALADHIRLREPQNDGWRVESGDAYDVLTIRPESKVVLVGAFPPYMKKLRALSVPFALMELNPSILKPEELPFHVSGAEAEAKLRAADIAIVTGTVLLNGSFDNLAKLLPMTACMALIGPTVPLFPKAFEGTPVKVLGGISVHNGRDLMDLVAEAGSGYHFFKEAVERVVLVKTPISDAR